MAAIFGAAYAIVFFWRINLKSALGYASFIVAIFLAFWLSGVWEDAPRHAVGNLTPVIIFMIIVGAIIVLAGKFIYKKYLDNKKNSDS